MDADHVLTATMQDRLRARYQHPPRAYHSYTHAQQVAHAAADLGGDRACLLAAWFHDVVYEPGADDNEHGSAQLLETWLAGDPDAARAAALVRMTAEHDPDPDDEQACILSDADLSILAARPAQYATYRDAVRSEYAMFDDDTWQAGRAAVLTQLLSRPSLYATGQARRRWEHRARANLQAELDQLTGAAPDTTGEDGPA